MGERDTIGKGWTAPLSRLGSSPHWAPLAAKGDWAHLQGAPRGFLPRQRLRPPLPRGALTWAVRRCPAPEGVRLGPSPVRPRGSPGLRGPQRQAEGTGLPPYSRPPEVVAALAVHRAGFARSSRLYHARPSANVRSTGSFGVTGPRGGGASPAFHARSDSRGATAGCSAPASPRRVPRGPLLPGTLWAALRIWLGLLVLPQRLSLCGARTHLTPLQRPAGLRPPSSLRADGRKPRGRSAERAEYRQFAPPPPPPPPPPAGQAAKDSQCCWKRPGRGSGAGFHRTAPPPSRPARNRQAHWPRGAHLRHTPGCSKGQPRSPAVSRRCAGRSIIILFMS